MKIQAYIYHKRAEKYSDCQDYFKVDLQNNRIAVADGMSQSIYPQWWAKILVNSYLDKGKIPYEPDELRTCQKDWQSQVQTEIDKREAAGKNPWRLKNAIAENSGAGSTICGFSWNDNGWKCQCIGDSCIIVVYKDLSIKIHSSQEGEFGNTPDYLDSFRNGRGTIKEFQGSFNDVISILLVTDPFSELFQKHINNKEYITNRLREIFALSDHNSYCELIERWRDIFEMHNDDSTLIVLSDFSNSTFSQEHIDRLEDLCLEESKVYAAHKESQVIRNVNTTPKPKIPDENILLSDNKEKTCEKVYNTAEERIRIAEEAKKKAEKRAIAAEEAKERAEVRAKEAEEALSIAEQRAKNAEMAKEVALAKIKAIKPLGLKGLLKFHIFK